MAGFESQNFDPMVSDSAFFFQESSHHLTFIPIFNSDEWRSNNMHITCLSRIGLLSLNMQAAIFWQICHLVQENDVEREFQIHRTEHDYSLAEFWKWTLALLIGVIMGILGFLVDWGIEKLNNFKFDSTISSIRNGGEAILAAGLCRSVGPLLHSYCKVIFSRSSMLVLSYPLHKTAWQEFCVTKLLHLHCRWLLVPLCNICFH